MRPYKASYHTLKKRSQSPRISNNQSTVLFLRRSLEQNKMDKAKDSRSLRQSPTPTYCLVQAWSYSLSQHGRSLSQPLSNLETINGRCLIKRQKRKNKTPCIKRKGIHLTDTSTWAFILRRKPTSSKATTTKKGHAGMGAFNLIWHVCETKDL